MSEVGDRIRLESSKRLFSAEDMTFLARAALFTDNLYSVVTSIESLFYTAHSFCSGNEPWHLPYENDAMRQSVHRSGWMQLPDAQKQLPEKFAKFLSAFAACFASTPSVDEILKRFEA